MMDCSCTKWTAVVPENGIEIDTKIIWYHDLEKEKYQEPKGSSQATLSNINLKFPYRRMVLPGGTTGIIHGFAYLYQIDLKSATKQIQSS